MSAAVPNVAQAAGPRPTSQDASAAPQATLWDTGPVTGPGAESFASVPLVDDSKPFVPPAAEPPPPAITPEDVAPIANAVALYFQLGSAALIGKHPELLSLVPGGAPAVEEHFGKVVLFVRGAAEREAMRMGIRLPYQDLLVCAGAVGLATYGFVAKPPKNGNKPPEVVRDVPPDAKDANAASSPSSPSSADDEPEIILD